VALLPSTVKALEPFPLAYPSPLRPVDRYAHQAGVAVVAGIRSEHHEVSVFPSVEGQVFNQRPIEKPCWRRILPAAEAALSDDFDRVRARSHLQLDVLRCGVSDQHPHQDLNIAKAFETGRDGIGARHDHGKAVKPGMVGLGGLLHAGREAPHDDRPLPGQSLRSRR